MAQCSRNTISHADTTNALECFFYECKIGSAIKDRARRKAAGQPHGFFPSYIPNKAISNSIYSSVATGLRKHLKTPFSSSRGIEGSCSSKCKCVWTAKMGRCDVMIMQVPCEFRAADSSSASRGV